jgi:hypothetical protein
MRVLPAFIAVALVSVIAGAPNASASLQRDWAITAEGVGPIRLGQTLAEARRASPGTVFERRSDGEGVALVQVTRGRDTTLVVYAGEDDVGKPVDWSKTIERIEVFGSALATGQGVRPGALVADVEKIYGKVTEISVSEIESREYVTFHRQPSWLTFRLNYTGVFSTGSRKTTKYQPNAKILSITIAHP